MKHAESKSLFEAFREKARMAFEYTLITIEYEAMHAGQTAAGVEDGWYEQIEVFREGMWDDIQKRAKDRFEQLTKDPAKARNIYVYGWSMSNSWLGEAMNELLR